MTPSKRQVDSLRLAAQGVVRSIERRDAAIVEAHEIGMSLRQIADATGIPHNTVGRIIERAP